MAKKKQTSKAKKPQGSLVKLVSLGMIFCTIGLVFLGFSSIEELACFKIIAIALIMLSAIMMGFYLDLTKHKK